MTRPPLKRKIGLYTILVRVVERLLVSDRVSCLHQREHTEPAR